jgi:hypothetical protein
MRINNIFHKNKNWIQFKKDQKLQKFNTIDPKLQSLKILDRKLEKSNLKDL